MELLNKLYSMLIGALEAEMALGNGLYLNF